MISWLLLVLRALRGMARSRISLAAENAILWHQLAVLQRGRPRPLLRPADRVLWIWLCRHWKRWRSALVLTQPATVLKWHREGYRRCWRRAPSETRGGACSQHHPSVHGHPEGRRCSDLHQLAHLLGRAFRRVVDLRSHHTAPVELLATVRPGAHGAAEQKGGARGGHRLADPGLGETAVPGSDPLSFGAAFSDPRQRRDLRPVRNASAHAGSVIPGRSQLPASELRRAQRGPFVRPSIP
jgi:hypothetical protein